MNLIRKNRKEKERKKKKEGREETNGKEIQKF